MISYAAVSVFIEDVYHHSSIRICTQELLNVSMQVSVWYISRGSEGGRPPSSSTATPPVSFPFLVPRYEPFLCHHIRTRTAAVIYDRSPAGCAPSTAAHTGNMGATARASFCNASPYSLFPLCRHQCHTPDTVQKQRVHREVEGCSPPPRHNRFHSSPILQTSVSFRPLLPLSNHPACQRLIYTVSLVR